VASRAAFSSSSALERCSSLERCRSSVVSRCDSDSSDSVRALAMMVLIETPMVLTNWSMKARWTPLNRLKEASSMTPSTWSSYRIGRMTTLVGSAEPSPELMVM
jgi:hypothetical protein